MTVTIALTTLVVTNYDQAIAYFTGKLGFQLIEDTPIPAEGKRWVVVSPSASTGSQILLAEAKNAAEEQRVGDQTGGRVFLFLHTDDFRRDYEIYRNNGVEFIEQPREESYGTVAVFKDLYGNQWDLIQPK